MEFTWRTTTRRKHQLSVVEIIVGYLRITPSTYVHTFENFLAFLVPGLALGNVNIIITHLTQNKTKKLA